MESRDEERCIDSAGAKEKGRDHNDDKNNSRAKNEKTKQFVINDETLSSIRLGGRDGSRKNGGKSFV